MPKYCLIAGVNGAGKSTLYYSLPDIQKMPRVNADELVKSIGDWKNKEDVMKASRMAVGLIKRYLENEVSFLQETTLCGKSVLQNIKHAENKGYTIEIHYVGLESVEIAKDRVHQRVLAGGHGISDEDIERKYDESFLHMKQLMDRCDTAIFYDNSVKFRRFAIFEKGKALRVSFNIPMWFEKNFI